MTPETAARDAERSDLLDALHTQRALLRRTLRDLSDAQAARQTTVSALCLGGIVKHLTRVEATWADFVAGRPPATTGEDRARAHTASFVMEPDDTLAQLLAHYDAAAAATDDLVASVDLDAVRPLPPLPWYPPGATRSNRRVFVHVVAETAQHAGHADIIRESLDGATTMG